MDLANLLVAVLSAGGAAVGAWAAVKATLADHAARLARAERDILGLRESRHYHADRITEAVRDISVLRRDIDMLMRKP